MLNMGVLKRYNLEVRKLTVGYGWLFDAIETYTYGYDCYKGFGKVIQRPWTE